MSWVRIPKPRAASACPSSWSTTQLKTRSRNASVESARRVSPLVMPSDTAIHATNTRNVTWSRTGIPAILPMPNDQRISRPPPRPAARPPAAWLAQPGAAP